MNHLEMTKTLASVSTADTATDATASHTLDTLGYDYASVDVVFEASTATGDAVASALFLSQSDDNTTFTNITEFVGGGTGGFTIPASSSTGAANVVRMNVDLRGKARYLKVNATPAYATRVVSVARLGKADVGPVTAAEVGVAATVSG